MAIYDATSGPGVQVTHTRHEAAAVHMADAWGRLTGTPGVALVTAGPGHMNALSACYSALMTESPLVLLSGHAPLSQLGRGAFQEMDQVAAARPVTKEAWLARDAAHLDDHIARALAIATSDRPGPVHVSLPNDLLDAKVDGVTRSAPRARRADSAASALPDSELHEALDLLAGARRPVILAGPAMARAPRWGAIERFAAVTGIPALPIESPRGLNDPWLHLAAPRLGQADVVMLAGRRPDFTVRFAESPPFQPGCRFVRVDWGREPDKRPGFLTLTADPQRVFERLTELASKLTWSPGWGAELQRARRTLPAEWDAFRRTTGPPLHPLHVCTALQPWLDEGAVLVGDGGEFGQWIQGG